MSKTIDMSKMVDVPAIECLMDLAEYVTQVHTSNAKYADVQLKFGKNSITMRMAIVAASTGRLDS